jgi:hypothetical protein
MRLEQINGEGQTCCSLWEHDSSSMFYLPTAAALPVPSVGRANQQAWRSESVEDGLGNAVALKRTSSDGKFDLIILQRGTHSFLSFVRQARWESVHNQPAKES